MSTSTPVKEKIIRDEENKLKVTSILTPVL